MDFNAVPWQTHEVWSFWFLVGAAVIASGFPIDYVFRGKWRTDHGAKLILASKTVLAVTLHVAWFVGLLFHMGHILPGWALAVVSCSMYTAIAATQGAMWIWLRRILAAPKVSSVEEELT